MKRSISKYLPLPLATSLPLVTMLLVLMVGCEQQGPAERAGEKIDDATEEMREDAKKVGNKIEDACEELKDDMNAEDTDC